MVTMRTSLSAARHYGRLSVQAQNPADRRRAHPTAVDDPVGAAVAEGSRRVIAGLSGTVAVRSGNLLLLFEAPER
jgi:hypothetical protein